MQEVLDKRRHVEKCSSGRRVQEEQKTIIKEKPRSAIDTHYQPTRRYYYYYYYYNIPPPNFDTNDLSLAFVWLQKQSSFPLGFDDLGNPSINSNPTIVDALRNSFLGNQNFYYGFGNENDMVGEVENMGFNGDLMVPYNNDEMKQELCMAEFDSGRGSLNGFNSSRHGLLNSPLM